MKKSGWLVLTGLAIAYAANRKYGSIPEPDEPMQPVLPLSPDKPNAPKPTTDVGKLFVTVILRASGTEKFAINLGAYGGETGLKNSVIETAQKLIPKLNQGPIPIIVSKAYPKSFKSVDGGYKAVIGYLANFHHGAKPGPVKPKALEYITKVLKSDPKYGDRIKSVTAAKVA